MVFAQHTANGSKDSSIVQGWLRDASCELTLCGALPVAVRCTRHIRVFGSSPQSVAFVFVVSLSSFGPTGIRFYRRTTASLLEIE
eukprot:904821-Pleurochrysis_carterae.AAC.2